MKSTKLIVLLFFISFFSSHSQIVYLKNNENKIQAWQDHYSQVPNVANCQEGSLTDNDKAQILNYINFIRSIHNLIPVQYDLAGDAAAQKAALIQTANSFLSHTPPTSASCYSADGYYGSENSNLFLFQQSQNSDIDSRQSITGWMWDNNSANAPDRCGHRRAIINPFVTAISFGRVDGPSNVGGNWCTAMALKYMDNVNGNLQSKPIEFVAYPYEAYPIELVDKTWYLSFSPFYDMTGWSRNTNIDYTNAQISVTTESQQTMNVHDIIWDFEGWGAVNNNLRWKVDNLQNEVKYLVNIKNINVNGMNKDYSYWFKLTTNIFNQKPNTPLLSYPDNFTNNVSINVGFSWSVSEYTYQYQFQLASDANFQNIIADQKTTTNGYVVKGLKPQTQYYWRVKAINDIGESDWSVVFTFTTAAPKPDKPTLAAPPTGTQNISLTPTLYWMNIPGAEKYQLQVSYKQDFSGFSVIVDKSDITDTLFTIPSGKLNNLTTYYWRVASIASDQKSTYSSVWTFRTKAVDPTPSQTILSKPENNSTNVKYNPLLDWEDVQTATSYRLQVSKTLNFTQNDLVINKSVPTSNYQVMADELAFKTHYYWRVQAVNETGYGDWSQIWEFTTEQQGSVDYTTEFNSLFTISPNPANSLVTLSSKTEFGVNSQIEIIDILGNSIMKLNNKNMTGKNEFTFDVSSFLKGVYFVRINLNGKMAIIKFEKL